MLQVFVWPQLLHTCYPSRYFTWRMGLPALAPIEARPLHTRAPSSAAVGTRACAQLWPGGSGPMCARGLNVGPDCTQVPSPCDTVSAHVHLLSSSLRVLEPCPGLQLLCWALTTCPLPSAGWYPAFLIWMGTPGTRRVPPAPEHSYRLAVAAGPPYVGLVWTNQLRYVEATPSSPQGDPHIQVSPHCTLAAYFK